MKSSIKKTVSPSNLIKHPLCLAITASAMSFTCGVQAQTASPQIEEVTVTAHKRAESVQDISASVAALSEKQIQEAGVDSFADYFGTVPGLSMVEQGPGLSTIAIRGVTTGGVRNDEPQNKETVGIYIDETPISVNGFNPDLGLYDVERVEVLRGPQGTLYGSGSMGGTIRIITNKPDFERFEAKADIAGSSTQEGGMNHSAKGAVNVPLIDDRLALRATAFRSEQDGYIDNTATGEENANTVSSSGARIQLGARVTDRLDANLSFMVNQLETGARSEQTADNEYATRAFDGLEDESKIANLTVNYEFDNAALTLSSSVLDKSNTNRISLEYLLANALGFDSASPLVDTTGVKDVTQEVRLASTGAGPLQWIVGAFYQDRTRDYTQNANVAGIDDYLGIPSTALGTPDADNVFYGTQNIDQQQRALFGEVSYDLSDQLTATLGLRYFQFEEQYETYSSGLFNGGVSESDGAVKEDGITPKLNLSYTINDDSMVYSQAAKGFRLGGVNTTVPVDLCEADLRALGRTDSADSFDSDSVWNYEVGSKNRLLDRRLTLNSSVYLIDWSDMQTTLSLPSCAFSFRTNAGEARSMGAEIETQFAATDRLDLFGTLGVTDSRLKEDVMFTSWEKGDRAPGVPRLQMSAGLRYAFDLFESNDAFVRLDYRYSGETDTRFDTENAANRSYGDYHLLNARTGVQVPGINGEVSLFLDNVLNSDGKVFAAPESGTAPERFITLRPRTLGVNFNTRF